MDQLHIANKVCGGCCAILLNTVDTESSVSPIRFNFIKELKGSCFDAERDIISKCTFLRMNGKLSKHP